MALVTTTDDLERRFRSDVDDPLRGPSTSPDIDALWSVEDVQRYMTDACDRVARRTLSLFRTFELPVAPGATDIALPGGFKVLDIQRARLRAARIVLDEKNVENGFAALDDYGTQRYGLDWEEVTGTPRVFVRGYRAGYIRLLPVPTATDSLVVTATISPALVAGAPLPFEDSDDLYLMLLWMKKLAYEKHDADTYDPQRAEKFEAEFERRVVDRKYEAQRIRRAPQPVQFAW